MTTGVEHDVSGHAEQMPASVMVQLSRRPLEQTRRELIDAFDFIDMKAYNHLVGWLRENDIAARALKVGDAAPDFLLPDVNGRLVSSAQLRREGPLVLSFFRGGWCPFCVAELCALQATKAEIEELGAKLLVVTPETKDFPRKLKRSLGLDLNVLSDVDYGVAMSYGVLFRVPDETKAYYKEMGIDFGARHGSPMWMLPMPATYVIDPGGRIRSAFVDPDFTMREEPATIVKAVRRVSSRR